MEDQVLLEEHLNLPIGKVDLADIEELLQRQIRRGKVGRLIVGGVVVGKLIFGGLIVENLIVGKLTVGGLMRGGSRGGRLMGPRRDDGGNLRHNGKGRWSKAL
jgi:hypothetical protein